MPFDGYFESLFKLAAKRPISEFQQGKHVGNAPQSVTEKLNKLKNRGGQTWQLPPEIYNQVKGGFCHGASLEWLRKVLQREDRKGVDHLKQSRVLRMTQTHLRNKSIDLGQMLDRRTAPLARQRDAFDAPIDALKSQVAGLGLSSKQSAAAALQRDFDDWARKFVVTGEGGRTCYRGTAAVLEAITQKEKELQRVLDALDADITENNRLVERIDALGAQRRAVQERINGMVTNFNAMSTLEARASLWNEIAAELDAGSGKARRFSGIVPVSSSKAETFANVREFLQSAFASVEFSAGRGMLVSMNLVPEPGHAIALHRDSAETVLLFDPNLGVYKFSDITLLMLAMIVLMEFGYSGRDSNGQVTNLGSKHSWQVFARTEALIPTAGGAGLANHEQIGLACDSARAIIDIARETAESLLETALEDAQGMFAKYEKDKGPDMQKHWIDAHNEAVMAFRRIRDGDMVKAKRTYSAMDGTIINLV